MGEGLLLWVHVTPRARRASVGGRHGDALRVAVSAPPLDGHANAACVRALAEAFGVGAADVELRAGARGRRKRIHIRGDGPALSRRLEELAASP